jgi:hypothetical protein
LKNFFGGGASPGSAGCFKKPTQIPKAGHPIYGNYGELWGIMGKTAAHGMCSSRFRSSNQRPLVPKKVPIKRLGDSTVNVPSGDNRFY